MTNTCAKTILVAITLSSACGSDSSPEATCEPSCLENKWWYSTGSRCVAVCSSNPQWSPCAVSDCEQFEGFIFGQVSRRGFLVVHSSSQRKFVLALPTQRAYQLNACTLTVEQTQFDVLCSGDAVRLDLTPFTLIESELASAIDQAATAGPGEYSY